MLPRHIVGPMISGADDAIDKALLIGSHAMLSPPRSEVGFVAAVTLGAIGDIAAAWSPLCVGHGFSLEISSVFCHAAPLVAFTSANGISRRCELADLLIAVDVITAGSFVRRATLIQAKMARAAGRVSVSGTSSGVQLDLYQNWYLFDFDEAAYGMSRVDFNVGAAAVHSGTFGVIDRHLKNRLSSPPVWTQHAARPTPLVTVNQIRLGEFITRMVDGTRAGFGRLCTPSLQTDWSKTVERLLTVTYGRNFHHKPTLGSASAPRGVSAVACLSFHTKMDPMRELWGGSGGQPPFDGVEIREVVDRPNGISIVYIAIDDNGSTPEGRGEGGET
jgi:hypothetical protein